MSSLRGSVVTRQAFVALFVTSLLLVGIPWIGVQSQPASSIHTVSVTENSPPNITVPDFYAPYGVPYNFSIESTDPDAGDRVLYTWDWGDFSALEVTNTTYAVHTYHWRDHILTVFADDLTDLPGHNVSDQGYVFVYDPNHAPMITQFVKDTTTVVTGLKVKFTGTATDMDGDICSMRFDFGDGTSLTVMQTAPNATVSVNHTYSAGGPKSVYLYADDGTLVGQTSMSFVVGTTFTLSLATGWNLVTVPRVGFGYMASTLGLNNGDTVSSWNSTTKTYKNYIVGVPVNNFPILPGVGYWISVPSGTRTLTLQGSIPTTTQYITVLVPEVGGWAMIGFNSLRTNMHAADIPAMFNIVDSITTVAKHNPATKAYTSWLSIIPAINNFALVPGQAYWILASRSGTLTYDP